MNSKQHTIEWNGMKVKIVSRNRLRDKKPAGFYVQINDGKSLYVDTKVREDAEHEALIQFKESIKLAKPKPKAKANSKNIREKISAALSDNKDRFIVMTAEKNSQWMTEAELKDKLFEFVKHRMENLSEFDMDDLTILKGSDGSSFDLSIIFRG